jgi:hypothetical protein
MVAPNPYTRVPETPPVTSLWTATLGRGSRWQPNPPDSPIAFGTFLFTRALLSGRRIPSKGRRTMKRALIVASMGILASTVWAVSANAQANINPNVYPGNTSGPYASPSPWEWHAGPGPIRRGNRCVQDVDLTRGYGFMKDCPAPQASAAPRQPSAAPRQHASRTAHHYHRKVVSQ